MVFRNSIPGELWATFDKVHGSWNNIIVMKMIKKKHTHTHTHTHANSLLQATFSLSSDFEVPSILFMTAYIYM